jgi:branched-chain amino acid aminotransferase
MLSTMTIPTCILTPQGVQPTPYQVESLADAASREPQGVYTVGRTFKRDHTLLLDAHLDRLENSAALVGLTVKLDRVALRRALRGLIETTDYPDARFRITIPQTAPDQLYLGIEPFQPVPPEIREGGARCVTVALHRDNPEAKTTGWVQARKSADLPSGIYEGLLVDEQGAILEGLSSNFYAIMDGRLHTAGTGVLPGIAQRVVLAVAPEVIPVYPEPITLSDLPFLDEAFITSAGRGIVPVIMINQQVIGTGQPSELTLRLRERYEAYTEAHLEPL